MDPFLREWGRMDRIVQEPSPVVVPQVVIWVFRANANTGDVGEGTHDA